MSHLAGLAAYLSDKRQRTVSCANRHPGGFVRVIGNMKGMCTAAYAFHIACVIFRLLISAILPYFFKHCSKSPSVLHSQYAFFIFLQTGCICR